MAADFAALGRTLSTPESLDAAFPEGTAGAAAAAAALVEVAAGDAACKVEALRATGARR